MMKIISKTHSKKSQKDIITEAKYIIITAKRPTITSLINSPSFIMTSRMIKEIIHLMTAIRPNIISILIWAR
jgi:hypothetical protein